MHPQNLGNVCQVCTPCIVFVPLAFVYEDENNDDLTEELYEDENNDAKRKDEKWDEVLRSASVHKDTFNDALEEFLKKNRKVIHKRNSREELKEEFRNKADEMVIVWFIIYPDSPC